MRYVLMTNVARLYYSLSEKLTAESAKCKCLIIYLVSVAETAGLTLPYLKARDGYQIWQQVLTDSASQTGTSIEYCDKYFWNN